MYKGIILAGGLGTRLRPITDCVCKQLLPVYDKPLIYYPLTTLILSNIKDILIISTSRDIPIIKNLIGSGSHLNLSIHYKVQDEAKGLADAFIIGEEFINKSPVCLILGDNILYKSGFTSYIAKSMEQNKGATIFGFPVSDPERFGIIELDGETGSVLSLEEKPNTPKSNLAAIGLYLYDATVSKKAKQLIKSKRGELEITDLNKLYMQENSLSCKRLSRGDLWMDVGIPDAFVDASLFIKLIEDKQGIKIGCPEEASYIMKNITRQELLDIASKYDNSPYGKYLKSICK